MAACRSLLCLFALWGWAAWGASGISAAEDSSGLLLVVNSGAVDVFAGDGRLLQSLPFDGETPDDENREVFAVVEDMNFDGFPDVRMLFSRGMINLYYDWWLWEPDGGVFVLNEKGRELSNPVFDHEAERISVYERGSALAHVSGELAWENGTLIWVGQTIQDEAKDSEDIVVRSSFRDVNGTLQLMNEETFRLVDLDEERLGVTRPLPAMTGLNLFLCLPAEPLDAVMLPNGEWWLREGTADRTLLIESRRLPSLEYREGSVRNLIRSGWPSAQEIVISPFTALAEKTSYPALKAEFLDGGKEDARQFVAALVFADEWSFWFVLSAGCDAELSPDEGGAPDASALGAGLKRDMEALLLDIRPTETFDVALLPGPVPMALLLGEDSPLCISVMDALIRIRTLVGPEHSPWAQSYDMTYRYDGPGMVEGAPVLLFSFEAEGEDANAVERHFAVDESGAVYEMDDAADGNYWRWEEREENWWGEYRRDDTELRIVNYREGPAGMYFTFEFLEGTGIVHSGTAAVRGRTATDEPLLFTLGGDDAVVTVTVSTEGEGRVENGFSRLAGVYGTK